MFCDVIKTSDIIIQMFGEFRMCLKNGPTKRRETALWTLFFTQSIDLHPISCTQQQVVFTLHSMRKRLFTSFSRACLKCRWQLPSFMGNHIALKLFFICILDKHPVFGTVCLEKIFYLNHKTIRLPSFVYFFVFMSLFAHMT
jgi:hypothetical protein